jgi:hypothetical protein
VDIDEFNEKDDLYDNNSIYFNLTIEESIDSTSSSSLLNDRQFGIKQVLRNFKFYETLKPRPFQNSNTFFFSKSLKTCLKIYFNQFRLI